MNVGVFGGLKGEYYRIRLADGLVVVVSRLSGLISSPFEVFENGNPFGKS